MNPYLILGVVFAVGVAGAGGLYKGHKLGKAEVQQAWDKEKAEQYAAYAKAQEEARKKEQELQATADQLRREKDEEIRDILTENNLKGIIWSIDLQDWNGFRGKKIIKQIEDKLTPGDIILFHDRISKADLINSLKVIQDRGFKIVSLEKLLPLEHDFPK